MKPRFARSPGDSCSADPKANVASRIREFKPISAASYGPVSAHQNPTLTNRETPSVAATYARNLTFAVWLVIPCAMVPRGRVRPGAL